MSIKRPLVICGFGRVGAAVAQASLRFRSPGEISIIDLDHERFEGARLQGYRSIAGDASLVRTLRIAGVGGAADIIICMDAPAATSVVRATRMLSSLARVQVVVSGKSDREALLDAGADDVLVLSALAGALLAQSITE